MTGDADVDCAFVDDNAQVAILLVQAHALLPPPTAPEIKYGSYLARAEEVVDFCVKGWDDVNGGGIRWHISTSGPPWTNRNACSTSLTSVACLSLAKALLQEGAARDDQLVDRLVAWGIKCVDWVWETLVQITNPEKRGYGLVMDGLVQSRREGEWKLAGPTYS